MSSSDITAIDNFCGCGGSTSGLKAAGIRVIHAANHWERAIESHNTNHPEVDHSCVDLHIEHPAKFKTTTIGWFSVECTTFSPAGGRRRLQPNQMHLWEEKKVEPRVERSRMGAWDVTRFTEFHRYQTVIVENVIEFLEWELFDDWIRTMHTLGYKHQCVYLNSMFAFPSPAPQSRDRIYIVFWRKGNKKPSLDFRPPGFCTVCSKEVRCVQAWKDPRRKFGKYGKHGQYLYTCPKCKHEVVPYRRGARHAIDWSIESVKIGDREALGLRPLSENTLRRIRKGLERFTIPYLVHLGHWRDERVYSTEFPTPTQTTKREMSLVIPPFIDTARREANPTSLDEPTSTVQCSRHHALIQPPFLTAYHGGRDAVQSVDDPSWTVATNKQFSLVEPPEPFISSYYGNGGESPVSDPSPTMRTVQGHGLVEPDLSALVEECRYRMLQAHEAKLLQGFDPEYIVLGRQDEQFKQIGNAVTPVTAEMLGQAVVAALS